MAQRKPNPFRRGSLNYAIFSEASSEKGITIEKLKRMVLAKNADPGRFLRMLRKGRTKLAHWDLWDRSGVLRVHDCVVLENSKTGAKANATRKA